MNGRVMGHIYFLLYAYLYLKTALFYTFKIITYSRIHISLEPVKAEKKWPQIFQ